MIRTKAFQAKIIESGIIENIIFEKTAIDVEIADAMKRANMELSKGEPYTVLLCAEPLTSISDDARKHIASEKYRQITLAKAILVSSLSQRLVANFYMRFNKPKTPTKSFNNRNEAIIWLRTFVKLQTSKKKAG